MRITPDEMFEIEMEVYKHQLANYKNALKTLHPSLHRLLAVPQKPALWTPPPIPIRKRPGAIRYRRNQPKE